MQRKRLTVVWLAATESQCKCRQKKDSHEKKNLHDKRDWHATAIHSTCCGIPTVEWCNEATYLSPLTYQYFHSYYSQEILNGVPPLCSWTMNFQRWFQHTHYCALIANPTTERYAQSVFHSAAIMLSLVPSLTHLVSPFSTSFCSRIF